MFLPEPSLSLPVEVHLRRLTLRLQEETRRLLAASALPMEPRWLPVYIALTAASPRSVTGLARALGFSHPAVLQVARSMLDAGWLRQERDEADGRCRLLALSDEATARAEEVERLLDLLRGAQQELFESVGFDVQRAAKAADEALRQRDLLSRARSLAEQGGPAEKTWRAPRSRAAGRATPERAGSDEASATAFPDFEVWR